MKPLIVCALIFVAALSINAQTAPGLLPFQGRLTDQNGVAVSNGVRLVQFKIYDVPTGGSPVWAGELHRTTVNGGLVNVLLGSKTPLTGVDFDKQLYLEITVDVSGPTGQPDNAITAADPPMLPRQVILPVLFAKQSADSRLLDGYDWSALFGTNSPASGTLLDSKIRDGSINAGKLQPGTITSNQIAPQTINASLIASGTIDISNLAQRVAESLAPAGSIIAYLGTIPPPGWLLCDGAVVGRTTYARLFAVIGTSSGPGDGNSTFHLPDLRGMFLRGVNGTRSDTNFWDPDAALRTNLFAGANLGNAVGSYQSDVVGAHDHGTADPGASFMTYKNATGSIDISPVGGSYIRYYDPRTGVSGGNETRPKNVYVNYIIKY